MGNAKCRMRNVQCAIAENRRSSSPRPSPPSDGGEGASAPARRGAGGLWRTAGLRPAETWYAERVRLFGNVRRVEFLRVTDAAVRARSRACSLSSTVFVEERAGERRSV